MNCPLCNMAMKKGYIPSSSIAWIPVYDKLQLIYKDDKANGFRIGKRSLFNSKKQPAWYCPICDQIIIDCKEEDVDNANCSLKK